jgi:hypothetical protein
MSKVSLLASMIVSVTSLVSQANGQETKPSEQRVFARYMTPGGGDSSYCYREADNFFSSNVMLNEINARAFRHFKKNYRSVSNEKWVKNADGISVCFLSGDSVIYHLYYNRAGRFLKVCTFYNEENMPPDLKRSIDRVFGNYSVLSAAGLNDGIKASINVVLARGQTVKVLRAWGPSMYALDHYEIGDPIK